ncbi:hypothetical protein H5410_003782 [Solanum commersonii]|uniref:Uncharacterized protein n=1 Tax=Solanum commersonii TaxID=4109 RepID=A0A9J6B5W5_SOLCO|nr:hypothetical protein H5410_003782 [Solanum commersonii]
MADREIGMDPREGTSHSPSGQNNRYPWEAQGESVVPLIPASPTRVEAQEMDTTPLVPIVPPPKSGE